MAEQGKEEVYEQIKALQETIELDKESLKDLEIELESLKTAREALRNELTEE